MRIWQIEPSYLTNAFRDFYDENPLNITRILDVAQDLKVRIPPMSLGFFLNIFFRYSNPYSKFAPSYLLLMSRRLHPDENISTWTSG